MPAVKHMKWWGWGVDGISFHHEDKPALGPFVRRGRRRRRLVEPTAALKLEDLDIHPPKIGDELRAATDRRRRGRERGRRRRSNGSSTPTARVCGT